jgi:hypothetical protein
MTVAVAIISLVAGVTAAWFCEQQLRTWHTAARSRGGPTRRRSDSIYASAVAASFVAGAIATRLFLTWVAVEIQPLLTDVCAASISLCPS